MSSDNPAVASAEEATGLQPLNAGPTEPQPPQHEPAVSDPTIDTIPSSLQDLPAPYESFVLALDSSDSRSASSYPSDSQFEDLVRAGLLPEGPVRAESVETANVKTPDGFEDILRMLENVGEGGQAKVYRIVRGQKKADVFVVTLDLDNDRLVGVKFPEQ